MGTIYTTVDVDVDIEIDEFVDSCTDREIQLLINYLMLLLSDKYYQMTTEEIEVLETLYNKYR